MMMNIFNYMLLNCFFAFLLLDTGAFGDDFTTRMPIHASSNVVAKLSYKSMGNEFGAKVKVTGVVGEVGKKPELKWHLLLDRSYHILSVTHVEGEVLEEQQKILIPKFSSVGQSLVMEKGGVYELLGFEALETIGMSQAQRKHMDNMLGGGGMGYTYPPSVVVLFKVVDVSDIRKVEPDHKIK